MFIKTINSDFRFLPCVTALAFAAMLAACGGGGEADTQSAQAESTTAAVAAADDASEPQMATAESARFVRPPAATGSVVNMSLLPLAINPAVTVAFDTHVAMTPATNVTAAHKLIVFLPGTGSVPTAYKMILVEGATKGYHAIGLSYPNATAIGTICNPYGVEPNCFWDVRREVITGQDLSPDIAVAQPDSIVTRLTNLISYLSTHYSTQGWNQYLLANGTVDWSKVVISGHSQGGGHAGVMAKMYAMHRACYFDAPPDWEIITSTPAPWESYASATPASAQYGFTHLADQMVPYSELSVIWQAMGLGTFGAPVSVDTVATPYAKSHQLTTNATSPAGAGDSSNHDTTIVDAFVPKTSTGGSLFAPVWDAACFQ